MQLKSLLYLASAVAIALCATVDDVLADLANVQTQVTALDNAVNAFPDTGGSLNDALDIHTDATNIQSALDTTTSDDNTLPSPVAEADGQSLLDAITSILPIIEDGLNVIVAKKPAFDALPIGGVSALILQDLQNLAASTTALGNSLISRAPADLVDQSNQLQSEILAAFDAAIAAYS